jgi:ribonuclease J
LEVQNGLLVKLAPGDPAHVGMVPSGYLGVDGRFLHPTDGDVLKKRRKMMNVGIVFVIIPVTKNADLASLPIIRAPGLIDEVEFKGFFRETAEELMKTLEAQHDSSTENFRKIARKTIQTEFLAFTGKEPYVEVEIVRV